MSKDYALEATIDKKFTTRAFATGIPTTLAGTPTIEIYEDNNDTPITAGITLAVDVNSRTGLNKVRILATAANGFQVGSDYSGVISAGTVSGVSVVGEVVFEFSIEKAPVNWANVTQPTTTVVLSGTTVGTTTTNTDMRGTDGANTVVPPSVAQFNARSLPSGGAAAYFDPAVDVVANVTLVATTSINTDMRGTNNVDDSDMRGTDGVDTSLMRGTNGANVVVPPSVSQFNDRTLVSASYALEATVAALNDVSTTDLLDQTNAALNTAIAELTQGKPTPTPTLRTGLMLLYHALRDRLDVNTLGSPDVLNIYNNAGTVIAKKQITDDGNDYSEAEMETGP